MRVHITAASACPSITRCHHHHYHSRDHHHRHPRTTFCNVQIGKLREYIDGAQEPELFKWWGQYCESSGQFDNALEYYNKAKDKLATVRVLCFHDDLERAAEIVNESEDDAAAFHLARQFEMKERIKVPKINLLHARLPEQYVRS
eukprot:3530758-Pleurochrysis_carterae.AAC.1